MYVYICKYSNYHLAYSSIIYAWLAIASHLVASNSKLQLKSTYYTYNKHACK